MLDLIEHSARTDVNSLYRFAEAANSVLRDKFDIALNKAEASIARNKIFETRYFKSHSINTNSKNLPDFIDNKEQVSPNFAEIISNSAGMDAMVYRRINPEGDMELISSFGRIGLKNSAYTMIKSMSNDNTPNYIIKSIFLGQSPFNTFEFENKVYSAVYRKLIDRKGVVVGMYALVYCLSDFIPFDKISSLTSPINKMYIVDSNSKSMVEYIDNSNDKSSLSMNKKIENVMRSSSSITHGEVIKLMQSASNLKDSSSMTVISYFKPWRWIIASEYKLGDYHDRNQSFKSMQIKLFVFAFSIIFILVLIYWLIISKINEKIETKQKEIMIFTNMLSEDLVDEALLNNETPKINTNNFFEELPQNLKKIAFSIKDLKADKDDLIEMLDNLKFQLLNHLNKNEVVSNLHETYIHKTTQKFEHVKNIFIKLNGLVENFYNDYDKNISSIIHKTNISAKTNIEKNAPEIMTLKLTIIRDKIDKILMEASNLRYISEQSNMLSVNTSIIAEKTGLKKLDSISTDMLKIADKAANSLDQFQYLISELHNSLESCENDFKTGKVKIANDSSDNLGSDLHIVLENNAFVKSQLTELKQSTGKMNEPIDEIQTLIKDVYNSYNSIIKNIQNCISLIEK